MNLANPHRNHSHRGNQLKAKPLRFQPWVPKVEMTPKYFVPGLEPRNLKCDDHLGKEHSEIIIFTNLKVLFMELISTNKLEKHQLERD